MIFGILPVSSCKEENDKIMQSGDNIRPAFNIQIPPTPITTQVPLEYNGFMSVIECQLNGMPAKMILDTGSETIGVFEDKLQSFSLKTIDLSQTGYTAGGMAESNTIEEFIIEFPGDIKILAGNCSVLASFPDKPDVDGIIGGPVFVALKATIDYDKKVLILNTSGAIQRVSGDK